MKHKAESDSEAEPVASHPVDVEAAIQDGSQMAAFQACHPAIELLNALPTENRARVIAAIAVFTNCGDVVARKLRS